MFPGAPAWRWIFWESSAPSRYEKDILIESRMMNKKYLHIIFVLCVLISTSNAQSEKEHRVQEKSKDNQIDLTGNYLSGLDKVAISFTVSLDDLGVLPQIRSSKASLALWEATWEETALKLRGAGIKISNEKFYPWHGFPLLSIKVRLADPISKQNISGYCYSVRIELREEVRLSRRASTKCIAPTWQRTAIGYGDRDELLYSLLKLIQEMADQFIIDYLKAN